MTQLAGSFDVNRYWVTRHRHYWLVSSIRQLLLTQACLCDWQSCDLIQWRSSILGHLVEEEVVFISSWRALLFFSFCLVFWFHCSLYSFALQGKPSFSSPLSPFWVQTPLVARIYFSSHLPFRGIIRVYKFGNININFLPQRIAG